MTERSTSNSTPRTVEPVRVGGFSSITNITFTRESAVTIGEQFQKLSINSEQKRSSIRTIKRKRFDDEIVEYNAIITRNRYGTNINRINSRQNTIQGVPGVLGVSRFITPLSIVSQPDAALTPRSSEIILPATPSQETALTSTVTTKIGSYPKPSMEQGQASDRRPRTVRSANKKTQGNRLLGPSSTKDLGRWKPIDDLALIISVQQTNDLRMIHRGLKFSSKFTLQELQQRWYALLYDPSVSRIACSAIRNLHPEMVDSVQRNALYSVQEEELLGTIKSTDTPKLEQFQDLLDKNAAIFYSARTAKSLHNHWLLLKQYNLLHDQNVKSIQGAEPLSFSDAEEQIFDHDLQEPHDEDVEIELTIADRSQKRDIRLLENELSRWSVLAESVLGPTGAAEFDNQTLACLCGRNVRYLMRSKEISFGRDAKDFAVDVDLSLEGPAAKISRRQGTIKLRSNGDFFIANEGKRAIFIDGNPILSGHMLRLAHSCTVEMCGLRFTFLVNYDLINAIRQENAKTSNPLN